MEDYGRRQTLVPLFAEHIRYDVYSVFLGKPFEIGYSDWSIDVSWKDAEKIVSIDIYDMHDKIYEHDKLGKVTAALNSDDRLRKRAAQALLEAGDLSCGRPKMATALRDRITSNAMRQSVSTRSGSFLIPLAVAVQLQQHNLSCLGEADEPGRRWSPWLILLIPACPGCDEGTSASQCALLIVRD
jgi:hypothetical protein